MRSAIFGIRKRGVMQDEQLTGSVGDAARLLRIGRNQAYKGIHTGDIPHIKIGKRILVLMKPLRKMLEGSN